MDDLLPTWFAYSLTLLSIVIVAPRKCTFSSETKALFILMYFLVQVVTCNLSPTGSRVRIRYGNVKTVRTLCLTFQTWVIFTKIFHSLPRWSFPVLSLFSCRNTNKHKSY